MIASMKLSQLAQVCNGKLHGPDLSFKELASDTRQIAPDSVYLALEGERFDGNAFASQALESGAKALVLSKQQALEGLQGVSAVLVSDTRYALGKIAEFCRDKFEQPVIAITGSSGKTTTREMLGAIVATQGELCMNVANENNEIGVPLTLLKLAEEDRAAVIEIGARHIGDIAYLGEFVKPNISILLNAGLAHVGEFGGYQNIVKGKSEIYEILQDDGIGIVNIDDKAHDQFLERLQGKEVLTFSCKQSADVVAKNIVLESGKSRFDLCYQAHIQPICLPSPGEHNVANALAASAAALAMNISLADVAKGLQNYVPEAGRLTFKAHDEQLTWIDDSYNANPKSMLAALQVLEEQEGERIAILGEMFELGEDSEKFHLELAEQASHLSIERFYLLGTYAAGMASKIGHRAHAMTSKKEIVKALMANISGPTVALLKGSRASAMEEITTLAQKVDA